LCLFLSILKNHTSEGFLVTKTSNTVQEKINDFWQRNKYRMKEERWSKGATEMNHWASPSYVVKVDDQRLRGGSADLKDVLQISTKKMVELWIGKEMVTREMYGIRVHTGGAIVPPHVDREPLVISAIVNVDQDLDESWVYELYKRDGSAVNVTLEPGGMLIFESASLIHGVSDFSWV
jgi:hypothetical protein